MRLPRGLVRLVLVRGKKPEGAERRWVVLAWMGGREADERPGDLGVNRRLQGTSMIGPNVGGLRGTGGL